MRQTTKKIATDIVALNKVPAERRREDWRIAKRIARRLAAPAGLLRGRQGRPALNTPTNWPFHVGKGQPLPKPKAQRKPRRTPPAEPAPF